MVELIRKFIVKHTDNFKSGHYLSIKYKGEEDSDEEDYMYENHEVEFKVNKQQHSVYHLILGIGEHRIKKLKDFDGYDEAELYAQWQYKLLTGNYPFIITGYAANYNAQGERRKLRPIENIQLELEKIDYNSQVDYIVIIDEDEIEAHSLNIVAEW